MKLRLSTLDRFRETRGAVAVAVTVMMVVLLAFGSLGVDFTYLIMIRNELQNAADAGALAGARALYNADGTAINEGANLAAFLASTANRSQGEPVEVQDAESNGGDVQRGHWSFSTQSFTPNDSLIPVELWDVSTAELDANPDFINAVRVQTRRQDIPANSFLARILGLDNFVVTTDAVAYIGFAGTLSPGELDQPIGICKQAITGPGGEYTCNTGRMISSSGGTTTNTGGWTNFSQPCETAGTSTVRPLVCGSGNENIVNLGDGIGTQGGQQNSTYNDMRQCWMAAGLPLGANGKPIEPWGMNLPVIDCPGNNVGPCSPVVGAVTVNVLWIKEANADPSWLDVPVVMGGWSCRLADGVTLATAATNPADLTELERISCWQQFALNFELKTYNDVPISTLSASEIQKTILFAPSCEPHELVGRTGGANFGVLADIPVLVN